MAELLLKFLNDSGISPVIGMPWSLPVKNEDGSWTPGEWMPKVKVGDRVCVSGWHFALPEGVITHGSGRMFVGEVRGEVIRSEPELKLAAEEGRLLYEVEAWADTSFEMRLAAVRKVYPLLVRPKRGVRLFDAIGAAIERGMITPQEWGALHRRLLDYSRGTLNWYERQFYESLLQFINPTPYTAASIRKIVNSLVYGTHLPTDMNWPRRRRQFTRIIFELVGLEIPESLTAAA